MPLRLRNPGLIVALLVLVGIGVALALLLHVTAAVVVVYGIYWVAEWLVSANQGEKPSAQENLQNADS